MSYRQGAMKAQQPGEKPDRFGYLKNQISSPSNLPTLRILWKVFFHLKMGWTNPQKSTFHIIPDHLKKTHPTKKNGVNGLCDFPHFSEASYPMDQKQSLFSMRRRGWRQMDTMWIWPVFFTEAEKKIQLGHSKILEANLGYLHSHFPSNFPREIPASLLTKRC